MNKRILLCVTGLSPQIVTETLYALAVQRQWVPDEVQVVTTATGAREAKLNLLAEQGGHFHRLCADYPLPPIRFMADQIRVLGDAAGNPMDDIRTPADNEQAADFITEVVRELTQDPDTELHVSMAGGRKTMGYYLGYALSLYGRPQDRLSHVLVSDPYENNRNFYYPTPYEQLIFVRRGEKEQTYDAREAKIDLAEIPFVRLRDGLPVALQQGQSGFLVAVNQANRALAAPRLRLDTTQMQAWADETKLPLTELEFVSLLWFAQAAQQEGEIDWTTAASAQAFLQLAHRFLANHSYQEAETALKWRQTGQDRREYFEPHASRVKAAVEKALGKAAATRYLLQRIGLRGYTRYALPLEPSQIEIVG